MPQHGDLEHRPDVAIFADTGWEPQSVYDHLDWLEEESEIPIVRVSRGRNLGDDTAAWVQHQGRPNLPLPVFIVNPDGSKGMMQHRQCTEQYKLRPMAKWTRENLLNTAYGRKVPAGLTVETWLGISYDEAIRVKDGRWPWQINRYPLIEKRMTRDDCRAWFAEHYPGRTLPRSACSGCPFRADKEWLHLKESDPDDFERAAEIDDSMRSLGKQGRLKGVAFLHHRRMPVKEAVEQYEQELEMNPMLPGLETGSGNECQGVCFV